MPVIGNMAYQQVISSKFLNTALEIQFFMNFDTFFLVIINNYYPVLHADHHFRRYMHQSINQSINQWLNLSGWYSSSNPQGSVLLSKPWYSRIVSVPILRLSFLVLVLPWYLPP